MADEMDLTNRGNNARGSWTRASRVARAAVDRFLNDVRADPRAYVKAALATVAISAAMLPIRDALSVLSVGLIFLLLSFVLALTLGAGPAGLPRIPPR